MLQQGYYNAQYGSHILLTPLQGKHRHRTEGTHKPAFQLPSSLRHLFSVSLALSRLNSSSSRIRALRQSSNTLTFPNPPSTATLEVLQTCTCLWGFIQAGPNSRPQTMVLSVYKACGASVVLFRLHKNSSLGTHPTLNISIKLRFISGMVDMYALVRDKRHK